MMLLIVGIASYYAIKTDVSKKISNYVRLLHRRTKDKIGKFTKYPYNPCVSVKDTHTDTMSDATTVCTSIGHLDTATDTHIWNVPNTYDINISTDTSFVEGVAPPDSWDCINTDSVTSVTDYSVTASISSLADSPLSYYTAEEGSIVGGSLEIQNEDSTDLASHGCSFTDSFFSASSSPFNLTPSDYCTAEESSKVSVVDLENGDVPLEDLRPQS